MNQKKNKSSSKQNRPQSNQLTITLHVHGEKSLSVQIPQLCPVKTFKQSLYQALGVGMEKIAYFQTTNADWLTDYKLQTGEGWIRNSINLQCVLKSHQYQKLRGIQAYDILKCIGVGGFSKVYLCRDKRDGQFYAAKFIQKARLNGKIELITNQIQVNQQIAFPFLVEMKEFFDIGEFYVMIIDYCPGGELFNLQKKVVRFPEDQARKYFIEVLLALEYLHSKNIIYRDLKPENIMIDLKGHIRIADFGLAKISREKRYSYCGSLDYMSPEIVAKIGHSYEVDFFCLGALLYEMVVGCPPFYEHNSTENETKARILCEEVGFPRDVDLSEQIKDLIRNLLEKDPSKRLGHLAGVKEVKCHSWIGWINKLDFLERKLSMPYPVNLDTFNFDSKDITASANRVLYTLNYERLFRNERCSSKKIKSKSRERRERRERRQTPKNTLNGQVESKNHGQKFKLYKRQLTSLSKEKSHSNTNYSKEKGIVKHQTFNIKTKKKHSSTPTINKYQNIRNCYMSSNSSLPKLFRFPTETNDAFKELARERGSYVKIETENKENKGRYLRKKKAKQDYAFQNIKRRV